MEEVGILIPVEELHARHFYSTLQVLHKTQQINHLGMLRQESPEPCSWFLSVTGLCWLYMLTQIINTAT